jgi:phosphoglycerate dehydrogenase-like enzyme
MCSDKPKVLIAIPEETRRIVLTETAIEQLRSFATVHIPDDATLSGTPIRGMLDGASVMMTGWRSPKPDSAVLGANGLQFIAHTAGSVRFLGVRDAIADGHLRVSQAASQIAPPVAEFVIAAALEHLRRLVPLDGVVRHAELWPQERLHYLGEMLCDQTVGIVGVGYVGRLAIGLFKAFGCPVVAYDPFLSEEGAAALGVRRVDLDELFTVADLVSLHAPSIDETRHMITAAHLASLRDGALLINTARGALIEESVLVAELKKGRISAALDVFLNEPLPAGHPLLALPNVRLSPHASGHSKGSYQRQGLFAVSEVIRFLGGEPLLGEITPAMLSQMA